ncbi:MAG: C26 family cysteine hydrolase domain-containing family, partial [Actinobacteria bacterium]|nr:C26 family cysteine hydrolase domain-containing family [Actinomycetota bacterium]
ADAASVPVLGVCFGAQLLAHALGGSVRAAAREEIGWFDIEVVDDPAATTLADRFAIGHGPWFQWHLDVFTPPPHATTLAHSTAGPQAFVVGRMLGVQFHPEVNRSVLETWMVSDRDQLLDSGIDPDAMLRHTDDLLETATRRCEALLRAVVDRL